MDDFIESGADRTVTNKYYVDSLKSIREHRALSVERMDAADKLGNFYLKHDLDSAILYMRLALEDAENLGSDEKLRLRLTLDTYMPLIRMSLLALQDYESIDPDELDEKDKRLYYLAGSEMYFNIQDGMGSSQFQKTIQERSLQAIDSALTYYNSESPVYQYLQAYACKLRGDDTLSAAILAEILPRLQDKQDLYVRSALMLAEYYSQHPEKKEQYFSLLNDLAMRGFREGVNRPVVLARLGKELCLRGDDRRGAALLTLALTSKDVENGMFSINDPSEYYVFLSEHGWRDMRVYLVLSIFFISVSLLAVIAAYMQWRKKRKVMAMLRKQIHLSARLEQLAKDEIRHGITLAMMSLDSLQEFNLYSMRKLTAGQTKGLLSELESGKILQGYRDKFFRNFDEHFLAGRPDFIERLNALLRPEARFPELTQPVLTPELRIAAFMTLGFSDSAMIAQSLGLSLNTVYTYRNRLKGRAADRVTFERKLQDLSNGTI